LGGTAIACHRVDKILTIGGTMECQVCNQEKKTGKTYKFFAAIEGKTKSGKFTQQPVKQ